MHRPTRIPRRTLAIVACLVSFSVLSVAVVNGWTQALDDSVLLVLGAGSVHPVGPELLPEVVRDVTALGSTSIGFVALLLASIWLVLVGKRREALVQFVMVVAGVAMVYLLKDTFNRARPDLFPEMPARHTASYPSGHTMTATVVYLTIAVLLVRDLACTRRRLFFVGAASVVAVCVGLSRVYLGAHFPSDVLAAWLLGGAWALAAGLVVDLWVPLGGTEPRGDMN